MLIYPAIDLLGGKCVRLTHGAYDQVKNYDLDPVEVALGFVEAGASWIHVVDLDAARSGEGVNLEIIRQLASQVRAKFQVGGGVRSLERARTLLEAGVARVVVGSKLAEDRDLAKAMFAEFEEAVAAGIDSKGGFISIHGWTQETQLQSVDFARELQAMGARRVIVTDIARDGAMVGVNAAFMRDHVEALEIPVIASGGVTDPTDITRLRETGAEGAIVGKALYEGRVDLEEAFALAQ